MAWNGQSTGYAAIIGPLGVQEAESLTCSHCQKVAFSGQLAAGQTFDDQGKKCRGCNKWICAGCTEQQLEDGRCVTFEQKADEMERAYERQRGREALFKAAGVP